MINNNDWRHLEIAPDLYSKLENTNGQESIRLYYRPNGLMTQPRDTILLISATLQFDVSELTQAELRQALESITKVFMVQIDELLVEVLAKVTILIRIPDDQASRFSNRQENRPVD